MNELLQNVNAVVGVTGSFVCDSEGRVLASAWPGFSDEKLSQVGRIVTQTLAGLELARRRKVEDLDLAYQKGRLVVKNLRSGCLIILCLPTINVPLLNLTANVAARKLAEQIKASKTVPVEKPALYKAKKPPGPVINGAFFSQVEQELTRFIGPMAAFVLREQIAALGETREAFPQDKASQLVEKLAAEIDGEEKRAKFQQVALEILAKVTSKEESS